MRAAVLALCLVACTKVPTQAVGVLIDTSGTYVDQSRETVHQIKTLILPEMSGGDKLVVMKIDSSSYGWDNMIATITIPSSRTEAAAAKRSFIDQIGAFDPESARYTDISGAILYCHEYLSNMDTPIKKILIFSDMKEELPKGVVRTFRKNELDGVRFAVVNTKRLADDQKDPEQYRKRMDKWSKSLTSYGAWSFEIFMGAGKLRTFMLEKNNGT